MVMVVLVMAVMEVLVMMVMMVIAVLEAAGNLSSPGSWTTLQRWE